MACRAPDGPSRTTLARSPGFGWWMLCERTSCDSPGDTWSVPTRPISSYLARQGRADQRKRITPYRSGRRRTCAIALPRWGSRVRIPSSAPGQSPFPVGPTEVRVTLSGEPSCGPSPRTPRRRIAQHRPVDQEALLVRTLTTHIRVAADRKHSVPPEAADRVRPGTTVHQPGSFPARGRLSCRTGARSRQPTV